MPHTPTSPNAFAPADIALGLLGGILAGADKLSRVAWLQADPAVAEVLGIEVVRLAEENAWGYVRIAGELKKLGHDISRACVRNLLKKHGLPISPLRKGLSWK